MSPIVALGGSGAAGELLFKRHDMALGSSKGILLRPNSRHCSVSLSDWSIRYDLGESMVVRHLREVKESVFMFLVVRFGVDGRRIINSQITKGASREMGD